MTKKHIGMATDTYNSISVKRQSRIAAALVNTSRKGGIRVITISLYV